MTITHVAIRYAGKVYSLPKPNRHHNIIRMIGGINGPSVEGFIDDETGFVNRLKAMRIAKKCGQLKKPVSEWQKELYSEDVW